MGYHRAIMFGPKTNKLITDTDAIGTPEPSFINPKILHLLSGVGVGVDVGVSGAWWVVAAVVVVVAAAAVVVVYQRWRR